MDWSSLTDLGSLASLLGLLVATGGLIAVGIQATAAKRAANRTSARVANVLVIGSGNRASTLIQEIKYVVQKGQWAVGYHQCHTLRGLLVDLKSSQLSTERVELIDKALKTLTELENDLDVAIRKRKEPSGADRFNSTLSDVQLTLDEIMSEATSRRGAEHG